MKLRVLAIALAILAFFLFVGSPFQQAAKAVVGVDDAVLLIILAALAAMGITFSMTGGINTVLSWLSEQIENAGLDFSGVKYGANSQGQILLNNRFLVLVSTLALYIKAQLELTDNSTVVIQEQGTIAGSVYAYRLPMQLVGNDGNRYILLSSNPDAYVFFNKDQGSTYSIRPVYFAYGDNPFVATMYISWGDLTNNSESHHVAGGEYVIESNYIYIADGYADYGNAFRGIVIHDYHPDDWNVFMSENVFGVDLQNQQSLIADAGILDIPDGTDIQDKGGILTLPIAWGETLPGAISQIPGLTLQDDLAGNVDLDIEDEGTVADQVDQDATNQITVSQEVSDYQVPGLASVFPFCIPFDIYNFVGCLAADPVAPSFTWRFYVPGICDESIVIDLSEFDAAAQILRTMELLLFCVGLAFVTRKIIRG